MRRYTVAIIIALGLLAIVVFNYVPSIVAQHHIATQARQEAETRDVAQIAKSDPSTWHLALVGKPYSFLKQLGLKAWEDMPRFGSPGLGQISVANNGGTGNHVWLVEGQTNGIITRMSPMLTAMPPK